MAEILHSGGANAVKNILRQMGTEATEEGASYFLNYVSDLAAADPDAKFSLAELAQSAAGGAFGGLVFGTAGSSHSEMRAAFMTIPPMSATSCAPFRTQMHSCAQRAACRKEQDARRR